MKYIPALFFVLFISCANKPLPKHVVPDDFNLLDSQIGSGKIMVYLNAAINDTSYIKLFHKDIDKKVVLVQCAYSNNSMSDSAILVSGKIIDYYLNVQNDGSLWKADSLSNRTVLNPKGKPVELSGFRCKKGSLYASTNTETWILKDTLFTWQGKLLPTLVTKSIIETRSNFLSTPTGDHNFKIEVISYFGKNTGCIKRMLTAGWMKTPVVSDLINVQKM